MQIQKLRLQRGWSQEQLAEISGLSVRTIQRLEKGKTGSLESLNALAAVFEIEVQQLQQENEMKEPQTLADKQENEALNYAKRLREFYLRAISLGFILLMLTVLNFLTSSYWWVVWVALGFSIHLAIFAFELFVKEKIFTGDWEKRVVEKRLGRKL